MTPATIVSLEGGPVVCVAPRPDLLSPRMNLELAVGLSPEEHYLIAHWLHEALSDLEVGAAAPALSASAPESLLQWQLETPAAESVGTMASALSEPQTGPFFSGRVQLLRQLQLEQREASSWALASVAHAALSDQSTAGHARASAMGVQQLAQRWRQLRGSARWTVAGSFEPGEVAAALRQKWKAAESQQPSTAAQDPAAPLSVIVDRDLGQRARAMIAWPLSRQSVWALRLARRHIIETVRPRDKVVLSPVQTAGVFAIVLEGPIEAVLETSQEIERTFAQLKTDAAAARSSEDWQKLAATVRGEHPRAALDPRCFGPPPLRELVGSPQRLEQSLQQTSGPATVYVADAKVLTAEMIEGPVRRVVERGDSWTVQRP